MYRNEKYYQLHSQTNIKMNEDIFKGKWKQIKGEIRSKWGKISHNEIEQFNGELKKLEGTIQEKYGHTLEEAKKQIEEFLAKFDNDDKPS